VIPASGPSPARGRTAGRLVEAVRGRATSFLAAALGLAFLAAFAALARDLGSLAPLDAAAMHVVAAHRTATLTGAALNVTALGSPLVLTLFTALLALTLRRLRHPRSAAVLVVAALGAALLTVGLKGAFERDRPAIVPRLVDATGFSFPSGHSLASAAIFGTAAVLVAVLARRRADRLLIAAVGTALLLAIGASRVYLGVHYPSDVLGGYSAGLAWAFVLLAAAAFTRKAAGATAAAPDDGP
jgi:undecaprenyl-diphosphatase